ncbi:MAG: hypothetical protein HQL95_03790 [Magnetococcales bacterium]|nr:hypothetical protein [Magnetococcales bacterium]
MLRFPVGARGWPWLVWALLLILLCPATDSSAAPKKRLLIVSSYHREYLWSQDTQRGVCAGLLEFGYLDNPAQGETLTRTDTVESSRVVVQKLWMDTKRKSSQQEMAQNARQILRQAKTFQPDLLLLGDDNAANYIGTQYLDTRTPVVFWGVNVWPLKYGLLDSVEKPGHNVTGVYQPGYMQEGLEFLVKLVPGIRTIAILADESETSLAKVKEFRRLERAGKLPVRFIGAVVSNDEEQWKAGALAMARQADAIYLTNHNTIKDRTGQPVDQLVLGAWYLQHVKKPDIGDEKQFVEEGVLSVADDSGFKQGYEAVRMAHRILEQGENPAAMPPVAPSRGELIVNRERARMLGLESVILGNPLIEAIIDQADALKPPSPPPP